MKLSEYLRNRIATKAMSRNWDELPASFEKDATQWLYKNHVGGLIDRRDIAARIKAKKATTFDGLIAAVETLKYDTELCNPEE